MAQERLAAALSDRYVIERELGAGGMATVYLAADLKHDRKVAIKVLRPELAAVIGAERFLKEIKTTANLQHPHILGLIDSGQSDGMLWYAMPFVDGESLRDRLQREKQLPIADAVRIATEVAGALDYAHRHGVIHRDIKPENILLHDGSALVADFGIALAASTAGTRMTETGMSLGTPHYMSPEQAMGEREITARSDVYALGCVLYEMLVGDPPFTGSTAQAIVAKVVTAEPVPPIELRKTIPEHVEAATLTALAKLPADRFATAHEFADALASPGFAGTKSTIRRTAGSSSPPRSRLRDPLVLGLGFVAIAAMVLAALLARRPPADKPLSVVRFMYAGSDSAPVSNPPPWPATISPDGSMLVYSASTRDGSILHLRRSDQLEAPPIPGTANAQQPLFSPDGQWLAFEVDLKEKKVRLDGSAPLTITAGGFSNGADWTTANELVVGSTGATHGLSKVSVAGGELAAVTHPDSAKGELNHLWPIAFPDGHTVVFVIWYGSLATSELAMTSLTDGVVTRLNLKGIRPVAVLDGALVYVQADGAVMAVPIDATHRRVTGSPTPVHDPVPVGVVNNGNSGLFISRGGAMVSGVPSFGAQLMWIGRDGVSKPISPTVREFSSPRLSPDGKRLAVVIADGSRSDAWILDLASGILSRLTTSESVIWMDWTRDGSELVFTAKGTTLRAGVWKQSVINPAPPKLLVESSDLSPIGALSPDGRTLLLSSRLSTGWKQVRVPLDSTKVRESFAPSKANDIGARFSPDGRWVALSSDESGAYEVYVRSFPDANVKVQVSAGGGSAPVWSADGTRLYYAHGDAVMQAKLKVAPMLEVVSRDTAFAKVPSSVGYYGFANYAITADNARIITAFPLSTGYRLVVVPNWLTEYRQRMAQQGKQK